MRKLILALAVVSILGVCLDISHAKACDKTKAQEVIDMIVNGGLAERQNVSDSITVWYVWKGNWYGMSREQRYVLIDGLGGAERCLVPGRAVRIRVAGKDVARSNQFGTELFD